VNYRSYGVGRVQKVRDEICKVEFNPSVFPTAASLHQLPAERRRPESLEELN
jgi:hypothetical protein